jgi:hypothetical protein
MANVGFLGSEFLTWLWFATEQSDDRIEVPDQGWVTVTFKDRLSLASASNEKENSVVKSEVPLAAEEARTALRIGKQVNQARLQITMGERSYELMVLASAYAFANVKLPSTLGTDVREMARERLFLLNEMESIVDGLYLTFMRLRRDPEAWATVSAEMRKWVRSDADA